MKFFKYFTYNKLKDICLKLEKDHCYYRHPKSCFIDILGEDIINKLLDAKCIEDSPHGVYPGTNIPWNGDYREPCYTFCPNFKRTFNYITVPFWRWFKIYILHIYWFRLKWQSFRIWCGHHYDWQDYGEI